VAGETTNQGYIDAQLYADAPSGKAPDQTHQTYGRGVNSYNLEQAGEAAKLAGVIDVNSSAPTPSTAIDASGNFMVGKTTSSLSNVGFEVQQSGVVLGTRSAGRCMLLNRLVDDGTIIDFMQNDSIEGSVSISGSTTAYNTTSDYRLKENVTPLTGATDRLKQIPVNIFNFIAHPDRTVDGFLAHEVQAVVPEAVQGVKDAVDGDGVPVYQQIDQSKLVPLLVATIQELEARITALEA
jgi:hypothetical protein